MYVYKCIICVSVSRASVTSSPVNERYILARFLISAAALGAYICVPRGACETLVNYYAAPDEAARERCNKVHLENPASADCRIDIYVYIYLHTNALLIYTIILYREKRKRSRESFSGTLRVAI